MSILSEPTLVLNKSWRPVRVCTVKRAFVLTFKGLARVMGDRYELYDFESWISQAVPDGDASIQTVSLRIRVPEVIVLTHCDRFLQPKVSFTRRNLYRRDRHRCQYCGKRVTFDEVSVDHVIPRSLGGETSWRNCVVACRRCNERKANRSPQLAGMKLLSHPREPSPDLAFSIFVGRPKESWKQFVGEALALDGES
ncbi:MAG TPA: HNH endonuclease [Planctomycetota bacterium]|nr:HNH endonuclease [Planctomycetota bacterium]